MDSAALQSSHAPTVEREGLQALVACLWQRLFLGQRVLVTDTIGSEDEVWGKSPYLIRAQHQVSKCGCDRAGLAACLDVVSLSLPFALLGKKGWRAFESQGTNVV